MKRSKYTRQNRVETSREGIPHLLGAIEHEALSTPVSIAKSPNQKKGSEGSCETMSQARARAIIIRDDKNRFKDLEGVVKVASVLERQAFKTSEHVFVKRIWQYFQ